MIAWVGSLSHYKLYWSLGIWLKHNFDGNPLVRIGYSPAGHGCYFKPLSGSKMDKRWGQGSTRTCQEGRRVHSGKPTLPLGFLFHSVKEKNCTQGTEVNKGHHSGWKEQPVIFHMVWSQGTWVILADGPLPAPLITNNWCGLSCFLPRPPPSRETGKLCRKKLFLFLSLALSPNCSLEAKARVAGPNIKRRWAESLYKWSLLMLAGGRVLDVRCMLICSLEVLDLFFLQQACIPFVMISEKTKKQCDLLQDNQQSSYLCLPGSFPSICLVFDRG